MRGMLATFEGLNLLNYVRTHKYCSVHDGFDCECGDGWFSTPDRPPVKRGRALLPRLDIADLRKEWREIMLLRQDPRDDESVSSAEANQWDDALGDVLEELPPDGTDAEVDELPLECSSGSVATKLTFD